MSSSVEPEAARVDSLDSVEPEADARGSVGPNQQD
jgi:hypothetical protein